MTKGNPNHDEAGKFSSNATHDTGPKKDRTVKHVADNHPSLQKTNEVHNEQFRGVFDNLKERYLKEHGSLDKVPTNKLAELVIAKDVQKANMKKRNK